MSYLTTADDRHPGKEYKMPRKAKKNAQGAGTIRKRADGRWEARYTIGFDSVTGKQKQKSIYGKTQGEVREKLAQITVERDDGSY